VTPFERYLTNWKSPEFTARYPDAGRYTALALVAAEVLTSDRFAVIELAPGDMTRYHFVLFVNDERRDGTLEYGLALINIGRSTVRPCCSRRMRSPGWPRRTSKPSWVWTR